MASPARSSLVGLKTRRLSEIEREEVEWLWPGRIARGKVAVLGGDPGTGKSWVSQALAAAASQGAALDTDPAAPFPRGKTLLFSAEDGAADTIRPRLERLGADLAMIEVVDCAFDDKGNEIPPVLPSSVRLIDTELSKGGYVAVIIDPIQAYFADATHSQIDAVLRKMLGPLKPLAEKHKVAIICVAHLNKNVLTSASYRIAGSIGLSGLARSVLVFAHDPTDPGIVHVLSLKNNIGPPPPGVMFEIRDETLNWLPVPSPFTAEELLGQGGATRSPKDGNALDQAALFLRARLASSPVPTDIVEEDAKKLGINKASLDRARMLLGVKAKKVGKQWLMSLPDGEPSENSAPIRAAGDQLSG